MMKCEVFLARSASYDEVRSPHKTWLFAAFHHFDFSGPGATAFVLSQEGDIRPPFFEVWEGRTYGPCNPLRAVGRCPTPCKPFEKGLSENFTCLHRTQARAFRPASLSRPRRLKAPFATCPAGSPAATCPVRPRAGYFFLLACFIRSSLDRIALRMRMLLGVTSTSSSSAMNSKHCSRLS